MLAQSTVRPAGHRDAFGLAFVVLLAVRSALDTFTDFRFGPAGLNIPALFGLAFLALAAVYYLAVKDAAVHGIVWAWVAWLAILLLPVRLSALNFDRAGGFDAGREWIRLATIPAVFFLAYNLAGRLGGRRAVRWLFLALPLPMAVGVYQTLFHKEQLWAGIRRVHATFAHPNCFGLFLILFIGLTLWEHRRTRKPGWLLLLLAEIYLLVMTLNIGGFLMFGLLLAWVLLRESAPRKALAAALALVFVVVFVANKDAISKVTEVRTAATPAGAAKVMETGEVDSSLSWRYLNWRNLLKLWDEKPLLGHGLQATGFINPWVTAAGLGYAPHNDFLRYLVEAGAVGLAGWLALLAACGVMLARAFLSSGSPEGRDLVWLMTGIFLASQAGSLGDNLISTTAFQLPFWAALGIAVRTAPERETAARAAARRFIAVYPIDDGGLKIGGVETFIREWVKSAPPDAVLGIAGVTTRPSGLRPGRWHDIEFAGRSIRFFPVLRVADPNGRPLIPLTLRFTAGLLRRRRRIASRGDALFFHRVEPALALGGAAGPKVLIIHGNASHLRSEHCESRWRRIRGLYAGLEPLVLSAMDRIFLVSRIARDEYLRRYPELAPRLGFLPTVFDAAVFHPAPAASRAATLPGFGIPDDGPLVVSVGRLEAAKDPALLLEVFARLLRDVPDARLAVVGTGTLEADLKARARALGIEDRTHWLGRRSQARIAEILNAADLFLLTSAFEGMPVAVLEALACGLPVVSTRVGEIPAPLADGRAGRVVDSRSADDLAAAARELLERRPDPALWSAEMSAYSSDRVFGSFPAELLGIADERI